MPDQQLPGFQAEYPNTEGWITEQAQEVYTFEGFGAGLAIVIRKADGVRGTLNFNRFREGRIYFDFEAIK